MLWKRHILRLKRAIVKTLEIMFKYKKIQSYTQFYIELVISWLTTGRETKNDAFGI